MPYRGFLHAVSSEHAFGPRIAAQRGSSVALRAPLARLVDQHTRGSLKLAYRKRPKSRAAPPKLPTAYQQRKSVTHYSLAIASQT